MVYILVLLNLFGLILCESQSDFVTKDLDAELTNKYWEGLAKIDLFKAYHHKDIEHKAKNVIIFLGDGMGVSTITPSRILKGQLKGRSGEEEKLVFEDFPNTCLIKTYNVDYQVPDSAGTATAFLTGVKTNKGVIGVNARVKRGETDCETVQSNTVSSIMDAAFKQGKATGVVTNARITHATPAGAYASSPDRDWEGSLPKTAQKTASNGTECKDIARQLVENHPGNNLNVILGGGARYLYPENYIDTTKKILGRRTDGLNLIDKWLDHRKETGLFRDQYKYVYNRDQLMQANRTKDLKYLLGIFHNDHMSYDMEREPEVEPSLEEMTETAIRLLQKNNNGFVLLVEGGRIDMAHHENKANLALFETVAFDRAIERALQLVSTDETLVVVTADHSHSFTMNGYPARGHNIMGIADKDHESNKPFTTLLYANGPGYRPDRPDPSANDTTDLEYQTHSGVFLLSAHHGGEDVALYAVGPMSHLFRGTKEQSYVAHAMELAACLGDYNDLDHCIIAKSIENNSSESLISQKTSILLLLILNIFIALIKF